MKFGLNTKWTIGLLEIPHILICLDPCDHIFIPENALYCINYLLLLYLLRGEVKGMTESSETYNGIHPSGGECSYKGRCARMN